MHDFFEQLQNLLNWCDLNLDYEQEFPRDYELPRENDDYEE